MNNDSKKRLENAVMGFCIVIAILCVAALGHFYGYRRGQIDAAQGRATYLVIDSQVVHIEGPAPECKVQPKDIERGSKGIM